MQNNKEPNDRDDTLMEWFKPLPPTEILYRWNILVSSGNAWHKANIENSKSWDQAINSGESDRSLAIVALCTFDNILEKLIKTVLLAHRKSDKLFKNEHMLQNTSSKIQIAYYLGLIPGSVHHDLLVLNKIRNIFAHSVSEVFSFDSQPIFDLLLNCKFGPRNIGKEKNAKMRFVLIATQMIDYLSLFCEASKIAKLPKLVDIFPSEIIPWEESGLTKEALEKIEREHAIISFQYSGPGVLDIKENDYIDVKYQQNYQFKDRVMLLYDNSYHLGIVNEDCDSVQIISSEKKISVNVDECEIKGKIIRQLRTC